jgi:hypothetical protein
MQNTHFTLTIFSHRSGAMQEVIGAIAAKRMWKKMSSPLSRGFDSSPFITTEAERNFGSLPKPTDRLRQSFYRKIIKRTFFMNEKKSELAHSVRYGKIQVSIWANDTSAGIRFNVSITRLYLEKGEWKRSNSFGKDEILVVREALADAWRWMSLNAPRGAEEESQ